jgi:hypothetical protein
VNFELIGHLVRLRYKLLWARTRSRNGKIALFVCGYLLLILVLVLLSLGGFSAGMAAVRLGKAELVAQVVLSSIYVQALMIAVMLGFGLSTVFSEEELRRYPLAARERRLARHLTGILDPLWFLVLALDLGLAIGLYAMGAAGFWTGVAAALLLIVSNYLLARMVALAVERIMLRKMGSLVILVAILTFSVLPGTLFPLLDRNPALRREFLAVLRYSPPFGAATAMAGPLGKALPGFLILALWVTVFLAIVMALERRPPQRMQAAVAGPIAWSDRYERIATFFFGAENAPLVGHWLRFYVRNNRFRTLYLLTIPLAGFLTFQLGHLRPGGSYFVAALGTFAMCSFMGTSRIAVNLFGYTGGAFRRFFLLPTDPAGSLRAGSYASLLLGGSSVLVAAVVWVALAPAPYDARMFAMLISSGAAGLFAFHGAGLWTTVYGARRGNYASSLGNDMSAAGNVMVIGGMLACMFLPGWMAARVPAAVAPANWWLWLLAALAAAAFYRASLAAAAARFVTRRERLLAVVEGRA